MAAHPSRRSTTTCGRSPPPASCSARGGTCRPRRTSPSTTSRASRRRDRRLGRCVAGDDRPREPGGAVAGVGRLAERPRAASSSRRDSPSTRVRRRARALGRSGRGAVVRRASDAIGLARDDSWAPGEPVAVPFVVRRDAPPLELTGDELGEDEITRLLEARGGEAARVCAAADRLRRQVAGDEVTYVVTRNIQYTNVCYFRCGFCAFSKGKLAAEPARRAVPRPARRDRPPLRGGVGAGRDGGLPPGRDPPGLHRRVLRRRRTRDPRRRARGSTCTRSRRSRSGKALRRSGSRWPSTSPTSATSGSARCRAPRRRSSTTMCVASSVRTR